MPADPELPSENGLRRIASWHPSLAQIRRWALNKCSFGFLAGIRAVLGRDREGFDWKEIAARLHVGATSADDVFWNEIRCGDSSEKALSGSSARDEGGQPGNLNLPTRRARR